MPIAVASWWWSSFFGVHFSEGISFLRKDGHCVSSVNGFGIHCFGDWISPVTEAQNGVFFIANSAPVNLLYSSIAYIVGEQAVPRSATIAYLFLLTVALSVPIIWVFFSSKIPLYKCLIVCGPFTLPGLTILDRGNNFGFAIPFLLAFAIFFLQGNEDKAIFFLIVSSIFKPHLLVLLVVFLINRKIWYFVRGTCFGLTLHLAASLVYQPNPLKAIQTHFNQLVSYGTYVPLDRLDVSNISIAKGFHTLVSVGIGPKEWMSQIQKFPTQIGIIVLCVATFLIWKNHEYISKTEQLTILLPLSVMFPGVTFAPYLGFVLIVAAIQLKNTAAFIDNSHIKELVQLDRYVDFSLIVAISLSLCSITLPFSSGDVGIFSTISFVPLVWIHFIVLSLLRANRRKKLLQIEVH
jgi:hypothetical protein